MSARGTLVLLLGALVLAAAGLLVVEQSLRPALVALAEMRAQARAVETIHRAVLEKVAGGLPVDRLYTFQRDRAGNIAFVQPNTPLASRVAAEVALAVQEELGSLRQEVLAIPIGQVTGSQVFALAGPSLHVRVLPAGPVHVDLQSRFEGAGVNQTRHIIELRVRADMQVVAPFYEKILPVEQTIDLFEGIIVGPVPSGILDLRPSGVGATSSR